MNETRLSPAPWVVDYANLTSAARDLYAALLMALADLQGRHEPQNTGHQRFGRLPCCDLIDDICAALAKARGER